MLSRIRNIVFACIVLVVLGPILAASPTEEQIDATHEGLRDALNTQNMNGVMSYFHDDATYDYVPAPPVMNGKQEIQTFFEDVFTGLPDFYVEQRNKLISGSILITECTLTGTHLGEIFEIPGTGNPVRLLHMDIYEFEDDKIKHMTTYDDAVSFLVQFGVMPAPDLDPALLVPSFPLPDPEPTGLTPVEAALELDALYDAHDAVNYAKKIHPDAEILLAPLGVPLNRDAFIAVLELYWLGFPDLNQDILRTIDMGDGWVLAETVYKGTNNGPYFGMPATRRSSEVRGAWIARIDADGLTTNLSVYFDNITILANLGLFPPPNPEANKAVVERWLELWNTQDLAIADEVFATDFAPHTPHFPHIIDVESYKAEVANTPTTVPDFHATLDDIVAEGDKVVGRFTATGTAQGEIMGIPVDGVGYTNTWIIMFRFANGKIVEEWWQMDMLGVLEQWGAMPPSRPTPESYTWGAPSELTGDPGDPTANTALVLYFVQKFWNEHNVAALDDTNSRDMIAHDPATPGHPLSFHVYKHVGLLYLAAFPDFRVTVESIVAEADKVAVRWTMNGTHLGELMGIPPTGRSVTFAGTTIHRVADGNIVENWWSYDALGMMQQITAPAEP